jgi:hypothetical protein
MINGEKFMKFIFAGIRNVILASLRDTSKIRMRWSRFLLWK